MNMLPTGDDNLKNDSPLQQANDARESKRRSMPPVAMVALLAIGGGLVWMVQSNLELWRHIGLGSSSRVSTSMRQYDVVLRVAGKGERLLDESAPPMEWTLRLPRTFMTNEIGTNGVTYRRTTGGGDEYFVDFQNQCF